MENIISSIEKALGDKNYFGALFMAVCIPEICGKLEFPSNKHRYKEWFEKYMPKKYNEYISGSDAFSIRCALLHEASSRLGNQKAKEALDRYFFTNTRSHLVLFDNTNGDGARQCVLNYETYCKDIIESFREFQRITLQNDPGVKERYIESEQSRIQSEIGSAIPGVLFL